MWGLGKFVSGAGKSLNLGLRYKIVFCTEFIWYTSKNKWNVYTYFNGL